MNLLDQDFVKIRRREDNDQHFRLTFAVVIDANQVYETGEVCGCSLVLTTVGQGNMTRLNNSDISCFLT